MSGTYYVLFLVPYIEVEFMMEFFGAIGRGSCFLGASSARVSIFCYFPFEVVYKEYFGVWCKLLLFNVLLRSYCCLLFLAFPSYAPMEVE